MHKRIITQTFMTLFQLCLLAIQIIEKFNDVNKVKSEIFLYLNVALIIISIIMTAYYDKYNFFVYCLYRQSLLIITFETVRCTQKQIYLMVILVWVLLFETIDSEEVKKKSKQLMYQKIFCIIYISLRLSIPVEYDMLDIIFIWIQVVVVAGLLIFCEQIELKVRIDVVETDRTNNQKIAQVRFASNPRDSLQQRKEVSISIKKEPSVSHSQRKDASGGDINQIRIFDQESNSLLIKLIETEILTKIIDQFPTGVAIIKFQSNRKPFVEYCNDTIKTLLKFKVNGQLLKQINNLKRQQVITHTEQTQSEDVNNIYRTSMSKFESFSQANNEQNFGLVTKFLKTGSDHIIQIPSKCQYSRFLKSQIKSEKSKESLEESNNQNSAFYKQLSHLSIQIHKPAIQSYLIKLKSIFELYSIVDGYQDAQDNTQNQRCIEIKLFMSFQNHIPQILLLSRDVSHRDHIKLLQQHNKAMSNQLNFVSHEYRTPLSCIITMLEMCQDDELNRVAPTRTRSNSTLVPETKLKFIQVALQNCKYLSNLSNDLLDLALIKVDKFKLRKQTFNLKEVLEGCLDMFNILAEKKKINLKLVYPDNLQKMIFQDNNRVQQIIINLLGNAFKFTLKGDITIEVSQRSHNQFSIAVSDTGVGIREQDQLNLFTAFGRLDSDENKKLNRQGVGLGLLISNMISRNLNQEQAGIQFNSEYQKGTTFYFNLDYWKSIDEESWNQGSEKMDTKFEEVKSRSSLLISGNDHQQFLRTTSVVEPLPKHEVIIHGIPQEDSAQITYVHPKSFFNAKLASCKCVQILVVDDNQFNIDVLQLLLQKRNIPHIDYTISGDMTIARIEKRLKSKCCKAYRLIFLDLEMPDMSGISAFKIMSTLFAQHHTPTPVIACSGYHKDTLKEKCLSIGMQDYLEKPVNRKELDRILLEYYY